MKRFIALFSFLLLFSISTFGQLLQNAVKSLDDNGGQIKFVFALSAAAGTYDSLRSSTFTLDEFDGETYFTVTMI